MDDEEEEEEINDDDGDDDEDLGSVFKDSTRPPDNSLYKNANIIP